MMLQVCDSYAVLSVNNSPVCLAGTQYPRNKPAKVHAFQTLVIFRMYHKKKDVFLDHISRNHVNLTEVIQAMLTGRLIPKSLSSRC